VLGVRDLVVRQELHAREVAQRRRQLARSVARGRDDDLVPTRSERRDDVEEALQPCRPGEEENAHPSSLG
jgi:hypothetical protein